MSEFLQMLDSAIITFAANFAVGVIVLVSFGLLLLAMLFFLLAVRGIWRWLTRRTWADVVRSTHRKALR